MSHESYSTLGMIARGHLKLPSRVAFEAAMACFPDGPVLIEVRLPDVRRSLSANRLYWSTYVQPLADWTGYTKDEIHAYLKQRFLPQQHLMIQNNAGEIIDETDIVPSTRTLTKAEFTDYLQAIDAWAIGELGVTVGSTREAVGV